MGAFVMLLGVVFIGSMMPALAEIAFFNSSAGVVDSSSAVDNNMSNFTQFNNSSNNESVKAALLKLPLSFIENRGQLSEEVKFMVKRAGQTVFFSPSEVVFALSSGNNSSVVRMSFEGSRSGDITGEQKLSGTANFFMGNDSSKWVSEIPTYGSIRYKDLYPGVDLLFKGTEGSLKHELILNPGANISKIALAYSGQNNLSLTVNGSVLIETIVGNLTDSAPICYQEINGSKVAVEGQYRLINGQKIGFDMGDYDRRYSLVIDPTLAYSTYLGGSNDERSEDFGVAVDNNGNAYVTGLTESIDFPIQNSIQASIDGSEDVFITKINAAGSAFIYSTYLGGGIYEANSGSSIAVDGNGNAYITCTTQSPDFPIHNPIQASIGGFHDAIVAKINAAGSALIYSTFLGGSDLDISTDIAVDSSGNAYVTGYTASDNFPVKNPIQISNAGSNEAFITKINAAGSALVYSSYLGGSDIDWSMGIAADSNGNAYVTGGTHSADFPIMNPIQADINGSEDAFITKIDASGSAFIYSTYLGGRSFDRGEDIAVDTNGNAYVIGSTYSDNFPVKSPLQASKAGDYDAFVTKINEDGSTFAYSTYLGGRSVERGKSITVDIGSNAYVTGLTYSNDFPIQNSIKASIDSEDVFITKINAAGQSLIYSTYLGGSVDDAGYGVAIDRIGNAYVTGDTSSIDFPTINPIQASKAGGIDAFVAVISSSDLVPGISLIKMTNGEDANSPPGPYIPVDGGVTWKYIVTTASNDPLHSITVADSTGVMPAYISGDANSDGLLTSDETWIYQATGIAVEGQYANIGTVTGSTPGEQLVTDEDPSHYYGIADQKLLCASGYKLNGATNEGLSGWEISLKNSSYTASTITNSIGYYEFCGLTPGLYTVTEIPQPGWTAIGGPTRSITLVTNNLRNVNFTNDNSGGMPDIPEILDIEINPSEMDMVPPLTEKEVTFKATVKVPEGYEIILYAWMIKDLADPSKNVIIDSQTDTCKHNFGAGEYGKKEVRCLIKSKKIGSNDIVRAVGSKEFKVFFPKYKEYQGIPNWFECWKKDNAVPDMAEAKYDGKEAGYGYSLDDKIYLCKLGSEVHYPGGVDVTTDDGIETYGGDGIKGIDCAAEVIAHENYHKWVAEELSGTDSDKWQSDTTTICFKEWNIFGWKPCVYQITYNKDGPCPDKLPDWYENDVSHTNANIPDTWNVEEAKNYHPQYKMEYATYGDQEYMAMRAGNEARGNPDNDWAYPGKQTKGNLYSPNYKMNINWNYSEPILETEIDGNYSDEGVDLNQNSLFDYLRISTDLNISRNGTYSIIARLNDSADEEVAFVNDIYSLSVGIVSVNIDFDGLTINRHQIDGPYMLTLTLYDDEGFELDSEVDVYQTAAYSYTDFEGQQGTLAGNFSDLGIDSNGDGIFEVLNIIVGVITNTEGNFTVEGFLCDQENNSIASASAFAHLLMGNNTIVLSFNGTEIAYSKRTGPYLLRYLKLIAENDTEIDFELDAYSTSYYETSDFFIQDARLKGVYTDLGADEDGDGLFEYLQIDADANITEEGDFIFVGTLYNSTGGVIDLATSQVHLNPGEHKVPLKFDGKAIFRNGANETFSLQDVILYRESDMSIRDSDMIPYITANYSFMLFESGINEAPNSPTMPVGQASGIAGTSYNYSTVSTDPDGDQISYTFDWRDGTNSTTALFDSGAIANAAHTWNIAGIYAVKAKATDSNGLDSEWSNAINVSIANNSCISGTKFNDSNSNATRDPGEAGLSGWTIRLTRPDGTSINATTDANGSYKFENLISGTYRVSEIRQSNWTQTYPAWLGDHIINVTDGSVTGVDFGNNYLPVPEIPFPPSGPASGIPGAQYSYTTSSTDPSGYQIAYTFDWGDGINTTTGLFDSGAVASAAHIWNSSGIYQVRAMATNSKGASSGWSDPLEVDIAAGIAADKIGVFRNGPWYIDYNGNKEWDPDSGDVSFWFGTGGDLPFAGDWSGDDVDEIGVFRNGPWYIDHNGNRQWDPDSGDLSFWFGTSGDFPIAGDWNGDGRDEIGVFRNGPWYLDYNGNRVWDPDSGDVSFWFGTSGDLPIAGDWNGDGKDEIGVFRNGPWYLDYNGNREWDPASGDISFWFGTSGDAPLAGDWNSDGRDEIGVFRNGPWYLDYNGNREWDPASGDVSFWFGTTGDKPVKGRWGSLSSSLGLDHDKPQLDLREASAEKMRQKKAALEELEEERRNQVREIKMAQDVLKEKNKMSSLKP